MKKSKNKYALRISSPRGEVVSRHRSMRTAKAAAKKDGRSRLFITKALGGPRARPRHKRTR
jgi:hypothetical protein